MRRLLVFTLLALLVAASGLAAMPSAASAQAPAACNVDKYDLNGDGRINQADVTIWENWYEVGDARADLDGSASIDKDADGTELALQGADPACNNLGGSQVQGRDARNMPVLPEGILVSGGPDAFGYTFGDETESFCAYDFVDIAATGTNLGTGDDTAFTVDFAALGAPGGTVFNYYGTDYPALRVGTNGFLATNLADTGGDLSNDCPIPDFPSSSPSPNGRIYLVHDDLDVDPANPGNPGVFAQYFPSCPRPSDFCGSTQLACTIVQWNDVSHYPGGGSAQTWDMQMVLYHATGEIITQLGSGDPEGGSGSTTGIQNELATTGLLYACNNSQGPGIPGPDGNSSICYLHPNLSVPGNCPAAPTATPPPVVGGVDVADQLVASAPASATPAEDRTGNLTTLAVITALAIAGALVLGLRRR